LVAQAKDVLDFVVRSATFLFCRIDHIPNKGFEFAAIDFHENSLGYCSTTSLNSQRRALLLARHSGGAVTLLMIDDNLCSTPPFHRKTVRPQQRSQRSSPHARFQIMSASVSSIMCLCAGGVRDERIVWLGPTGRQASLSRSQHNLIVPTA